ncbi:hypothetical protein NS365_13760 [Aureimonas ureilytica]|uniref:Lipoprotein n=1 Tax=Aureimonas ureilytica TaxID=401562 RepID=A0A175RNP9_9HYPH|nr:hypothetical protein NS365_13760 [Aureimonas ureilytica]
MRYKIAALSASLLTLPLSGCVTTSADGVKVTQAHVTVAAGERTQIRKNWSIANDCSADGLPKVRVTQPPAHGQISIVNEDVYPNTTSRRFAKCRTHKVKGTATYYTPNKGYVGNDQVRLRQSYVVDGVTDTDVYIKVVR